MPVEPIERYLAYLSGIERSPNTVKAYAHDLKDYFVFLDQRGLDWREVRLEDVGEFVAWLRLPPAGRAGIVAVLPSVQAQVGPATINRKLSAVSAFYQHQARHGVDLGDLLTVWRPGGRGSFKPFLHHISKGGLTRRRAIVLTAPTKLPRVLTVGEVQTILDACSRLRDRLLFAILHESGMRIGEALGLRVGADHAGTAQLVVHPAYPDPTTVGRVDFLDPLGEPGVVECVLRGRPVAPLVETLRRHLEHPAHERGRECLRVRLF